MGAIIKFFLKFEAKSQKDELISATAEILVEAGEQPYVIAKDCIQWLKATVYSELGGPSCETISKNLHSDTGIPEQSIASVQKAQDKVDQINKAQFLVPETKNIETEKLISPTWAKKLNDFKKETK